MGEWIAISNIFIGMILIFLDFNLDIDSSRIGLLPDFLGYIFMLKGLLELAEFSDRFSNISPYVKGMIVYSGIYYVMDLFGISFTLGESLNYVLGLLSTILSLYISYNIIMGIIDIETTKIQNLNSNQLYSTWKLMAVFSLITYLFVLIIPVLAVISILASLVLGIYYLYIFYQTKNLFYEQNPRV